MNGKTYELVTKIYVALEHGAIKSIGSIIYDGKMQPICLNSDLKDAVDALNEVLCCHKIAWRLLRTDAGGSPTWDFVKI